MQLNNGNNHYWDIWRVLQRGGEGHHQSEPKFSSLPFNMLEGGGVILNNLFSIIFSSWLDQSSLKSVSSSSPLLFKTNNHLESVESLNILDNFQRISILSYQELGNDTSIEFPVNLLNLTTSSMSVADITFFSIGIVICIVNIFFGLAILLNQRFRVVKTKQPKMMAVSVVLGSISFMSYAYTNNMITNHPDLCTLINIWIVLFSLLGWMSCVIVRLITVFVLFNVMVSNQLILNYINIVFIINLFIYYGIINQQVKYNIKRKIPTLVWFLICMIPCLIACIIATGLDFNNNFDFENQKTCQFSIGGFILFVCLVFVYVVAVLIMSILTHNVRKAYSESKIEVLMLILIIITTSFIAICFSFRLNLLIPIRIIISYVPLFLSSTYFYAVMHRVIWYTIRSWMGCNRWKRDLSFFEDWDMRFFVDSNNTIFTNEQIRRVMNLETKAMNHQQLLERDDDMTNFSVNPFVNDSSINIEIGNYIPPSMSDSVQNSSLDSTTSSQMISDKKFFGLSPTLTPSPTKRKVLAHSSSKRSLHRVFGSSTTKSFVDGDEIVTEQDIINQTIIHNINMDLEDYSPPRYYIGRDSEKRR